MIRDQIHSWPKAELHCHLDGSVRLRTLLDIAEKEGKRHVLPFDEEMALQEELERVDQSNSLAAYLAWFRYSLPLLQSGAALSRAVYELAEDNAQENVRYLEIRYCPLLHVQDGLTPAEVNDAVVEGMRRAERDFPIIIRLIISAVRDRSVSESLEMAKLAASNRHRGVVAFDLASNETGNPASKHKAAFDYARTHLLHITAHAGESCGPDSIREATTRCGAERIGHGTSLGLDPELLRYVRDRRILLEICPTSNVQTGVVEDFSSHPLPEYVRAGIPVSISTDNRLFSRTSLTEELYRAHRKMGLSVEELQQIVRNGFRHAFLPFPERMALLESAEREIGAADE